MNNKIRKILAAVVSLSMLISLAACGKNTSAEESMREELESLRAQMSQQSEETSVESVETEESDVANESAVDDVAQETATETEEVEDVSFAVASNKLNMSLGEISKDGDFYCGLACVRVLDDIETHVSTYFAYDLPDVQSGQEVIYPIIQVYNPTKNPEYFYDDVISLYVDSVNVPFIDLQGYYFSIDDVEGEYRYQIQPGRNAEIVRPFIVDEGWTEITIFCGEVSWTITHDDVSSEPYTYSSLFNSVPDFEYTEVGTVVYGGGAYEIVYDGLELDSSNYTKNVAVFEFTVNNLTESMLTIELPSLTCGSYNYRMLYSTSALQDTFSGHTNAYSDEMFSDGTVELHPGMSAKIYISFIIVETTGTFECFFETAEEGVVAQVCTEIQ